MESQIGTPMPPIGNAATAIELKIHSYAKQQGKVQAKLWTLSFFVASIPVPNQLMAKLHIMCKAKGAKK